MSADFRIQSWYFQKVWSKIFLNIAILKLENVVFQPLPFSDQGNFYWYYPGFNNSVWNYNLSDNAWENRAKVRIGDIFDLDGPIMDGTHYPRYLQGPKGFGLWPPWG